MELHPRDTTDWIEEKGSVTKVLSYFDTPIDNVEMGLASAVGLASSTSLLKKLPATSRWQGGNRIRRKEDEVDFQLELAKLTFSIKFHRRHSHTSQQFLHQREYSGFCNQRHIPCIAPFSLNTAERFDTDSIQQERRSPQEYELRAPLGSHDGFNACYTHRYPSSDADTRWRETVG
jgi:hypothetical protein